MPPQKIMTALLLGILFFASAAPVAARRRVESLRGDWQFRRADADGGWKSVTLPANFEEHEGVEFDGVGIYRKRLPRVALPAGTRALLHFQAVATEAEVWFDGKRLGTHLGGWTPFRFDVTQLLRANGGAGKPHEIRVRVAEKVGHNSQGFLPVVCPHFGGIWQDVQLVTVPDTWIDDLRTLTIGDPATGKIGLQLPLAGEPPGPEARVEVRYRLRGKHPWSPPQSFVVGSDMAAGNGPRVMHLDVPVKDWQWWSPREPNLYELQHFDLAGPVIPQIGYLDQIDPILLLWATHDVDHVETHALLFETRVGRGRLLVSALRHTGQTNAAGQWLLSALVQHLTNGPKPTHALKEETRQRMRAKFHAAKIPLAERPWRFATDPRNEGLEKGWQLPCTPDDDWKEIRISQAWEGQGYPQLDGWAWYRIRVAVPPSWKDRPIYVSFEGVDDYYQLYVDGKRAGTGGNIEKQETAFEQRKSHLVTNLVTPGKTALIAVRVYDWYGAGGIFRPVTLGTVTLGTGTALLK